MREIKFRAFGKNSKEFLSAGEDCGLTLRNIQGIECIEDWELSQYTGLKDKNEVEIFEGDIIEYSVSLDGKIKDTAEVVWIDSKASFGIGESLLYELSGIKVIGNNTKTKI